MKDLQIAGLWLVGIVLITAFFGTMIMGLQQQNRDYNHRYELCIDAGKQWLDGNCINK